MSFFLTNQSCHKCFISLQNTMSVLGSNSNVLIFVQHLAKNKFWNMCFDLSDSLEIKFHVKDNGTCHI